MKRLLVLAVCSLLATSGHAANAYPSLQVGHETVYENSSGWIGDTYTFTTESGTAFVVRGESGWALYLSDAWIYHKQSNPWDYCIVFRGSAAEESFSIRMEGENTLVNGGIEAKKCSRLAISGPGSLTALVKSQSGSGVNSSGDLLIHAGAAISVLQLWDDGDYGISPAISAENISVVNAALGITHRGDARTVYAEGSMDVFGSVVAVYSDCGLQRPSVSAQHFSISHSSLTIFGTRDGLAADDITVDTAAIGIASWGTGIIAQDVSVENSTALVLADGDAIVAEDVEFGSGNDLSIIGNAEAGDAAFAAIRMTRKNGAFLHRDGNTRLFAPNGAGIRADGSAASEPAAIKVSGGRLSVSSDPDWEDVRSFFTAASIASAARTVLQGAVSGETTLAVLLDFFGSELLDGYLAYIGQQVSSARPVRGISAESVRFTGGTTEVECRTDANGIVYSGSAAVSGGKVFVNGKAWGPTLKVVFNPNGGSVSPKSRKVASGARIGTLPKPTRKGFVFAGWFTAKTGGAKVTAATKVSRSMTLYARWAKKAYKVKFLANGGKGTMAAQKMKYGKAAKLRANKFKRKGCVFLGWAKTKKGALAYRNRQAVKNLTAKGGAVKLYAKWGKKVRIRFVANGGKVKKKSKTATTGRKLGTLPVPKRTNWNFEGWWTKKTGSKRVTASTVPRNSMAVYARWTPIVALSLDANGGTLANTKLKCRTVYYSYNGSYYLDTHWSCQNNYSPARDTFVFRGWSQNRTGGRPFYDIPITKPCTLHLYAQWSPVCHEVCFSGPSGWEERREFHEGDPLGDLPVPPPPQGGYDYTFLGWWSEPDRNGIQITESTIADDSLPSKVYAAWSVSLSAGIAAGRGGS